MVARPVVPAADTFAKPISGVEGAYYRKVMSNSSRELNGVKTSGVLPTPTFDPARQTKDGPLDIPDVYLGGASSKGATLDCGMTWERVHSSGRPLFTDTANGSDGGKPEHQFHKAGQSYVDGHGVTLESNDPRLAQMKPDFAYHPYFRTDFHGVNTPGNHDKDDATLKYFYLGQAFTMNLNVDDKGKAVLAITSQVGSSPHDKPGPSFAAHFDAPGFADASRQFKRAISIDLEHNEGKVPAKTGSTLSNGGWNSVLLTKFDDTTTPLTPAHGELYAGSSQLKGYSHIFNISNVNAMGGEWVSITPPRK